ncbi:MAG: L-serine ammonia-lyase, iron-sulfur-dependent, subunit alpha, partial [Gordonibacter pamelaeae]
MRRGSGGRHGRVCDRRCGAGRGALRRLRLRLGRRAARPLHRAGHGLAGAFLAREQALAALDGRACDALPYADRVLAVMRASATEPLREPVPSMGGLIGGEARDVRRSREQGPAVVDGLAGAAMEYALAVLETNASMGRIVAA